MSIERSRQQLGHDLTGKMTVYTSDAFKTHAVASDISAPPPAYEETFKDEPPSYQSLLQQLKEIKRTSSTPLQFFRRIINISLVSVLCKVLIALSLAIPVSMIVVGAVYKEDCPLEPRIPIYLIVAGVCYLTTIFLHLVISYGRRRQPEDAGSILCKITTFFLRCVVSFLIAIMIVGNVWVYSNYSPSDDIGSENYCFGPLYYFAFWLMTIGYICLVSTCMCFGCMAACLCFSSLYEDKT